jgi:hypothetical protein
MRTLVESRVREELLYREALALGLDPGDTIVKRRLAQTMEFLFEDLSELREPASAEVERWFAEHAAQFALPARVPTRPTRSCSSRAFQATHQPRRRSPIRSCSRTTTAIARSATWRSRSDPGSPAPCSI